MLEVPVIPESAPFSAAQRLWLNGFIAGYFARERVTVARATSPALPSIHALAIRILFGSQTGTAQGLAKRIAKHAASRGCQAQVTDAADYGSIDWAAERHLLVITSTYGDGDMPDNAQPFWNWLQTEAACALGHLEYSVLALGDRNYEAFCNAGRKIDTRLEQLGAKRLYARADCDVDYDTAAKAWTDGVLNILLQEPGRKGPAAAQSAAAASLSTTESFKGAGCAPAFSKSNPFPARLLKNVLLTSTGSAKEVRHYELALEGSGLSYEPGDALAVIPVNCPELVADILTQLRCDDTEPVPIGQVEMPIGEALARHLDLTKPSPELVATFAARAPGCILAPLLAPDQRDALKEWLSGRSILDLLELLPEPIPPAELIPLLRKLNPRLYSISSSPRAHPDQVHLTVNVVRYQAHGRHRKGVASSFLADRAGNGEHVKVYIQPSPGFKLPADGNSPVIMVGPGTGIAPFRAFLEEREMTGAKGSHWLFFGDQRKQTDFLYGEQLTDWVTRGHIHRLDLAFSRDQAEKVYVQHRMLENAASLWCWLQDGAHFYVCGDAARMAKDVDATLHQVAQSAGGLSADKAREWVAQLKKDKRYQRDVY